MKSRRRNESEDGLTLTTPRRSMRLKSAAKSGDNSSLPIPIDVMIEILSRLPLKSIARCRCVSKLWASILRLPDFTELFLTKSSSRPRLLFACKDHSGNGKLFWFSTSQPQNLDDDSSSPLPATYHMNVPFNYPYERFRSIRGLVFLRDSRYVKGKRTIVSVICNPSTGQSLTLPKVKTRKRSGLHSYFGFDPVERQYKVLSMTSTFLKRKEVVSEEHQVLTLGTGKLSWRKIECGLRHYPQRDGIYINGVLYYQASVNWTSEMSMIVCFDVRSETFRLIKVTETLAKAVVHLIEYNGKLGALVGFVNERTESFKLWVLEDVERGEWSERTYVLPESFRKTFGNNYFKLGVTKTNEIVLWPDYQPKPFYIYYYNMERMTVARVEIQGMEAFERNQCYTLLDHIEDVKLLQMF